MQSLCFNLLSKAFTENREKSKGKKKFDLGRRHFSRKRIQLLFVSLVVHAFLFLYFYTSLANFLS